MAISEKSRDPSWSESRSSPEARRANLSVSPEGVKDPGILAGSGENSPGSLAFFDPATCCWRIPQGSLISEWDRSLETFPPSGTMRSGRLYRLARLARPIIGIGSGLLPTPMRSRSYVQRNPTGARRPRPTLFGLATTGKLWEVLEAFFRAGGRVATPRAADAGRGRWSSRPSAENGGQSISSRPLCEQIPGPLSPRLLEWLMGFPIDWSDTAPLETLSSPSVPSGSDALSHDTPEEKTDAG